MTNYNEEVKRDEENEVLSYIGISLIVIVLIGVLVISFL